MTLHRGVSVFLLFVVVAVLRLSRLCKVLKIDCKESFLTKEGSRCLWKVKSLLW